MVERVSLKVSERATCRSASAGFRDLYEEPWTSQLAMANGIRAFINEHDAELKAKPEA